MMAVIVGNLILCLELFFDGLVEYRARAYNYC